MKRIINMTNSIYTLNICVITFSNACGEKHGNSMCIVNDEDVISIASSGQIYLLCTCIAMCSLVTPYI